MLAYHIIALLPAMEGGGDNSSMILAKEYHGVKWMDSNIPLQSKIISPIIKVYRLICKFALKDK